MPVNIPRLNRIQPSDTLPSNDRIKGQAQDQSRNILNQTNQIAALGERGIQINKAYEDEKIDNLSSEANQAYAEWSAQKLGKLKAFKGDPTDAYAQYDLDEKEFFDKLMNDKPDLNERVRRGVTSNLAKSQNANRIRVLKQRGYQKEVYENNLFESDVKLKKNDLSVSAGYIKKGDRTSTIEFNQGLSDIKTLIAKRGLKNGTATVVDGDKFDHSYRSPDGELVKVSYSPMAKERAFKDLNEGVVGAVDVLISSDKPDLARDMMKDYASFIDNKSKAKFEKRLKTTEDKSSARDFLASIRNRSEDDQLKAIDNLKDGEVRSEALKIKQLDTSRRNALRKNQQDRNFEAVDGVIEELRASGQLYTEKSIEDHPKVKAILGKHELSKTQMRAIRESVKSPKFSEDEALNRVTNLFLGNEIHKLTPAQLTEAMVGLKEGDKSKFRNKYLSRRSESKGGAEKTSQIYNRAKTLLTDKMYDSKLIQNVDGFLSDDDFNKLKTAKVELLEYLDFTELGDKPSIVKINEHLDDFIKTRKSQSIFDKVGFGNWFKSEAPVKKSKRKRDRTNPLEGEDTFEWQRRYKKDRGSARPPKANDPDFLNYVRENK